MENTHVVFISKGIALISRCSSKSAHSSNSEFDAEDPSKLLHDMHDMLTKDRTADVGILIAGVWQEALRGMCKANWNDKDIERVSLVANALSLPVPQLAHLVSRPLADEPLWASNYLSTVQPNAIGNGNAKSLSFHLEKVAQSSVASPAWFHGVRSASDSLMRVLMTVVPVAGVENFGSCRNGLCGTQSDVDLTCIFPHLLPYADVSNLSPAELLQIRALDDEFKAVATRLNEHERLIAAAKTMKLCLQKTRDSCIALEEYQSAAAAGETAQRFPLLAMIPQLKGTIDTQIQQYRVVVGECLSKLSSLEKDRAKLLEDFSDADTSLGRNRGRKVRRARNERDLSEREFALRRKLKDALYDMGRALRRKGYLKVEIVAHARVGLVKLYDPRHNLDIDLVPNRLLAMYNSDFVRSYLEADRSQKVRNLALVIKKLVKTHGISDASMGWLSSYSWTMLLLHTLIRHEYLPGFQPKMPSPHGVDFCDGFHVGFTIPNPLPPYYALRLANVSLAELLLVFTEYLTSRIDITKDCLSLRGDGEILHKRFWFNEAESESGSGGETGIEVGGNTASVTVAASVTETAVVPVVDNVDDDEKGDSAVTHSEDREVAELIGKLEKSTIEDEREDEDDDKDEEDDEDEDNWEDCDEDDDEEEDEEGEAHKGKGPVDANTAGLPPPQPSQQQDGDRRRERGGRGGRGSRKTTPKWRISIEDPFERIDSVTPHDLGRTVTLEENQEIIMGILRVINRRLLVLIRGDSKVPPGADPLAPLFDRESVAREVNMVVAMSAKPAIPNRSGVAGVKMASNGAIAAGGAGAGAGAGGGEKNKRDRNRGGKDSKGTDQGRKVEVERSEPKDKTKQKDQKPKPSDNNKSASANAGAAAGGGAKGDKSTANSKPSGRSVRVVENILDRALDAHSTVVYERQRDRDGPSHSGGGRGAGAGGGQERGQQEGNSSKGNGKNGNGKGKGKVKEVVMHCEHCVQVFEKEFQMRQHLRDKHHIDVPMGKSVSAAKRDGPGGGAGRRDRGHRGGGTGGGAGGTTEGAHSKLMKEAEDVLKAYENKKDKLLKMLKKAPASDAPTQPPPPPPTPPQP